MNSLSHKRATVLKVRQKLGKYRIERRLADGGFAAVYEATDTIEGIRVALKIPHPSSVNPTMLEYFRREVRLIAKLDHPNILPLKDANGKPFGSELFDKATQSGTWVDYVYKDPATGKEEPKSSWVVRHDGYVFGCGVYRPTTE